MWTDVKWCAWQSQQQVAIVKPRTYTIFIIIFSLYFGFLSSLNINYEHLYRMSVNITTSISCYFSKMRGLARLNRLKPTIAFTTDRPNTVLQTFSCLYVGSMLMYVLYFILSNCLISILLLLSFGLFMFVRCCPVCTMYLVHDILQSTLDISKLWGLFFTSSNYPKCKFICTSGNLDF